ncbi:MAG: hypothetical protein K0V04_21735 [Deltaproteobacteria bacterium]|nr:hypothetical protein [Deltaproteobacteria bacterium]
MSSRTWGASVWWGGLVALIGLALGVWATGDLLQRRAEPRPLTVDEAASLLQSGEDLDYVRLVDLDVRCGGQRALGKLAYAEGRGTGWKQEVLVELDLDRACEDIARAATGAVRAPTPMMRKYLTPADDEHVMVLQPLEPVGWLLAVGLGLLGLGGWAVRSGLQPTPSLNLPRPGARKLDAPGPAPDLGDPYRSTEGDQPLLTRPLRASNRWRRRQLGRSGLVLLFAVLSIVGSTAWAISFGTDAARRHRVWDHGVLGSHVEVTGEQRSRGFVFRTTALDVHYTDANGDRHDAKVDYMSLSTGLDRSSDPVVRYDPADHDSIAISWAMDDDRGRLWLALLGSGTLLVFGLGAFAFNIRRLRTLAGIREIVRSEAKEVLLTVIGTTRQVARGDHIATVYTLELPGGRRLETTCAHDRPPFFLDVAQTRVLGLRHPTRKELVVALECDLGPLEVDGDESHRVRSRHKANLERERQRQQQ